MITAIQTVPVVSVKDGSVYANSRDVAAFFGKEHRNVLADIAAILTAGGLSAEISAVWFRPTTYEQKTGFGVRQNSAYDMTKDGFMLLVMGYTGAKAMQFKLAYIQRFNEMEETLKAGPAPGAHAIPQTLPEALRLAADAMERAEAAECVVNRLAAYPDMLGVQEAAKALKIAPKAFGRLLREWGWVYDRRGAKKSKMLAYQDTIDRGLMVHDAIELDDGSIKYHPKLTGKGLVEASKRLDAFE